jgi:hypothetical protein
MKTRNQVANEDVLAGFAALAAKIEDARMLSYDCWVNSYHNGNKYQEHHSAGQLDAFNAVLSWITEAQENNKISHSTGNAVTAAERTQ